MYITLPFWLFVLAILGIYALVTAKWQNLLLLGASFSLYAFLEPRFVVLLTLATGITYLIGTRLNRGDSEARRWLVIGVGFNIVVLAVFKYSGFFAATIGAALTRLGVAITPALLTLILPLGISFYTFRLLSYLFDVNKHRIPSGSGFVEMALYVSFFPQIAAGPIERAATFIPSVHEKRSVNGQRILDGLAYLAVGIVYKFVLADPLAHLTDTNFAAISTLTTLEAVKTLVLYGIRLYGDFAGYSAMAIGVSIWFGLPAMENFRQPYFSRGFIEFWTRWHISLSSWFRDYFFFPLSRTLVARFGSRRSFWIQTGGMFLTMALIGLWHGAAWTFLAWGLLQGVYMSAERILRRFMPPASAPSAHRIWRFRLTAIGGILITQVLVIAGWVFFRAPSMSSALMFFRRLLVPGGPVGPTWWLELLTPLMLLITLDVLQVRLKRPSEYWTMALDLRATALAITTVALVTILSFAIVLLLFFGGSAGVKFVYQSF